MATINISNGLIHSTGAYCLSAGSNSSYIMVHNDFVCVPTLCTGSTANFNDLVVSGDLTVHGSCTLLNTTVCTTSAMSICNQGTGPALTVTQCGSQPVALFVDQECGNALCIGNDGVSTFSQLVNIHNSNAGYGSRLSVGRGATESIYFQVDDSNNYIRANQDESGASHGFYLDRQFTTTTCRDDFHISRCGSPQVTVDICGNVGIGDAQPAVGLSLYGDANKSRIKLVNTSNHQVNIGLWDNTNYRIEGDANRPILITSYDTDGGVRIGASGSADMTVVGGKVGIGITNPTNKLQVAGNAYISSTLGMGGYIQTNSGNNQGIYIGGGGANITSVSPSAKDIVIQDLDQLRFGPSDWDYNCWAGIKYDAASTDLIIGGPNTSAFTSNSNPPNIGVIFAGVDKVTINNCGGSDCIFVITRSGSTTAGLNLGVCADQTAVIASENSDLRLGKKCTGTFYEYSKICAATGDTYINCDLFTAGNTCVDSNIYLRNYGCGVYFNRTSSSGSDYSNYIKAGCYPSQGYPAGSNYWLEYGTKGGHHFVVNTDGGAGSGENNFDDFTIWQGCVDGDRLFSVSNVGNTCIEGSLCIDSASTSGGNLKFTGAANPYICASSYIIMPGGLYVSGGTLYVSGQTRARGGICNDANTYLGIYGGTCGDTYFSGQVGIGTTDPSYLFQVHCSSDIWHASFGGNGGSQLRIGGAHGSGAVIGAYGNNTNTCNRDLYLQRDGGNVGIGTNAPERKLHVFKGESGGQTSNSDSSLVLENSSSTYLQFLTPSTVESGLLFGDGNNDVGALVYDHADDEMRFIVNAAVKTVIDSSGNVGIGTTSPAYKLDVVGTTRATTLLGTTLTDGYITINGGDLLFANDGGGNGFQFDYYNTRMYLGNNAGSTWYMVIQDDGNVGIGTTSPSGKLDVCGTDTVFSVNGTNGTLFSVVDDLSDSLMSVNDAAGLPVLEVFADSSVCAGRYGQSDFYIASGGNVGIATANPKARMQVVTTSDTSGTPTTYDDNGKYFTVGQGGETGGNVFISYDNTNNRGYIGALSPSVAWRNLILNPGGGNVGIGENVPLGRLHTKDGDVVIEKGDLYIASSSGAEGGEDGGGTGTPTIWFGESEGCNVKTCGMGWRYNGDGLSGDCNMLYTVVNGCSDGHLTVQMGGNVGIGTTSPGATLDVRGDVRLDSGGNTDRTIYFRNQSSSTTVGGAIKSDQYLSLWAGNGSGTPAQYFTIKPGGNVGIGTTDPIHALHVQSGSVFIGEAAYCATYCTNANGKLLNFDNSHDSCAVTPANKIRMHNASTWLGGFGICSNTVTYHSGGCHRWYTSSCPSSYGTVAMTLNSTNLIVTSCLAVAGGNSAYLRDVTGDYGSIEIANNPTNSWHGYSINGRAVFMHDNSTATGLYNDVNNHWLFLAYHGGDSQMFYNGSSKLRTTPDGIRITDDGSTPDGTTSTFEKGLTITGGNMRLNIDVSNVTNGGSYIQTRHASTTYPSAYYRLALNPLGGDVTINGYTAWHAGNDGSGSGLDADLLDGVHGSSFLRSDACDTVSAGVVYSWAATDTEGLVFCNSSYSRGLRIGGWTTANDSFSRIRNSTGNLHIDSACDGNLYFNHYSAGNVYIRGNTAWHAGNDGSGSGLDADLLDGQQGSYYSNYNCLSNKPTIPTNNNQLTNGAGYTTCTGDITNVTAGTGLTGGGTSGSVTLSLPCCITAGTYGSTSDGTKIDNITVDAQGRVTSITTGSTGSTSCTGDITAVTAGTCMTGGGTSGSVTISHADTSSQSSCGVGSPNRCFMKSVCVDGYGHVTSMTQDFIGFFAYSNRIYTDFGSSVQSYVTIGAGTGISVSTPSSTQITITNSCASDYRLKTCVESYVDAYDIVKGVEAYKYVLIDDKDQKEETGLIAHELQEVLPNAVIGEKDAVDKKGEPVYQEVVYSGLVPTLWSALRKSIEKIEQLEETNNTLIDRITKLEQAVGI